VKGTGYTLHSRLSSFASPSRTSPYAITFQLESTKWRKYFSLWSSQMVLCSVRFGILNFADKSGC